MGKSIFTNGNTVVTTGEGELGFSENPIKITPRFFTKDIHADDYGPMAPALVLQMLAEVNVEMDLVYFDTTVLYSCIKLSMASTTLGIFKGAGTILTGTSLDIGGSVGWSFPKAWLADNPMEWPLGNERSKVRLTWRCVGIGDAAAEMISQGVQLFS